VRESVLAHLGPRGDANAPDLLARHLRLGRALLAHAPEGAMGDLVFAIVQHLNLARRLLERREERVRAAELNMLASREALLATAHERAQEYARTGLALLGTEGWRDAYALARDLHLEAMCAESFAGDATAARACFDAARAEVTSESDKTALYVAWIDLETTRRNLGSALDATRERLAQLGVAMPDKVTLERLKEEHLAIRALRARRSVEELLYLPELSDPVHAGVIRTLVAAVPAAFFRDSLLRAWLHFTVVRTSLEHGVCEASSYGFSGYGTALSGLFDRHAEGAAFGRLALALNDRFQNEKFAAKLPFLYGGWHAPWVRPFADAKKMLRTAFDLAQRHGDTTYEAYAATVFSVISFCESADLAELGRTGAWARGIGARRKDFDMAGVPDAHLRYAAALRGETESPTDLGIDGSSDAAFRAELGPKTPTALFYYFFCNAELSYHFGDAARAHALLEEARKGMQVIFGLPTTAELCFLEALVAARLHGRASRSQDEGLATVVLERVRKLRKWARTSASNFEAHHLVARGELARIQGARDEARTAFERAVVAARVHRAPKREAIALELASRLAAEAGDDARAATLRADATAAYARWGAAAKARTLS
jgi:predicted ATPase